MNTIRNFCLAMTVILLASINLTAAELSADEVIAKANQAAYYAGKDGRTAVQMTISDAQGGTRQRAFTILRMNSDDDNQKFYVYFTAPADVRHSVMRPITGSGVSRSFSVLLACARPSTLRANSTTAACMP